MPMPAAEMAAAEATDMKWLAGAIVLLAAFFLPRNKDAQERIADRSSDGGD